ncbi:MAG TPA: hypothetical protein PLV25_05380, partial [Opitutales bacterium]|nr:hypothetical protein [Opitutales bacterium]
DMAEYVMRWLKEAQGVALQNDDIAKLVGYDWPKNFCELRLAVKYFLKQRHWPDAIEHASVGAKSLALQDALLREQAAILASVAHKLHAHSPEEVKHALYIEADKVLDLARAQQQLIYPELVH